jgi:hypothetical protein
MTRFALMGLIRLACLVPLTACVVAAEPPRPVYVAPVPVVVGPPPPLVVVRPGYHRRWYRGHPRAYWRRHRYH